MYKIKSTHSIFGARSFFLVHIQFTPNEGPNGFANFFSKKSDDGSWTIKSDYGKRPSSMVRLHGPWCKLALNVTYPSLRCMLDYIDD